MNATKEEGALSWELSPEVHQSLLLKYHEENPNTWLAHH